MPLCEELYPEDWVSYQEGNNHPATLEPGHPFSVYHLDSLLENPVEYSQRNSYSAWGVSDTAELFFHYLVGVVAGETEHIIRSGGVYLSYAKKLVERLNNGEDTGLAHPEAIMIWEGLLEEHKQEVTRLLLQAADNMDDFPNLGKMNVIFTNVDINVNIGPIMPEAFLPVTVETKKGIAAVIPSLSGLAGYHHYAVASALRRTMGRVNNAEITQYHLWDVSTFKISPVPHDDVDDAVAVVASMCE